jgi:hypothetical protein
VRNQVVELLPSYLTSLNNKNTGALREKLEREKHPRCGKPLSTELLEIGKRCAAHIKMPVKSRDHADMLYNQHGLPR